MVQAKESETTCLNCDDFPTCLILDKAPIRVALFSNDWQIKLRNTFKTQAEDCGSYEPAEKLNGKQPLGKELPPKLTDRHAT